MCVSSVTCYARKIGTFNECALRQGGYGMRRAEDLVSVRVEGR